MGNELEALYIILGAGGIVVVVALACVLVYIALILRDVKKITGLLRKGGDGLADELASLKGVVGDHVPTIWHALAFIVQIFSEKKKHKKRKKTTKSKK